MAATILTPADLAAELGTDARTARKFLRSITPKDDQPGKGSRWGIEKKNLRSLRTKFTAFQKDQADAKAARDAAKAAQDAQAIEEGLDPETFDPTAPDDAAISNAMDEDLEPTAEDLAAIDAED